MLLLLTTLRSGTGPAGKTVSRLIKLTAMSLIIAAVGLLSWFVSAREGADSHSAQKVSQQRAVPVLAAVAEAKDVPIVVRGIGSVQAFNTVTVKSRVDGNIVKVAFVEGQYVKAGDLLIQIDPRPFQAQLEQAEANKAKDQANLENAQRDLTRFAALLPGGLATTRQQYDTQRALVSQLTASVQADQAQIDAANLNVVYSSITSPIDGITGLRLVDIGNLVQASTATPLVVVTQIKPIYVTFTIPERDLDRVRQAMAEQPLEVRAFNGDETQQLSVGTLKVVNNQVDQGTGTVTLKAEFANQDAALWPGEFVNAHLVLDVVKNGVTVPSAAVQMGPTGAFVYVVTGASMAEVRPVTVTQVEGNTALIAIGLQVGDRVVVSGQTNLSPNAKVTVQPGVPGEMNAHQPEIGPEGVGSTGVNTGPAGITGVNPR
jgi:membrane fusion protein, multidrug efflux system